LPWAPWLKDERRVADKTSAAYPSRRFGRRALMAGRAPDCPDGALPLRPSVPQKDPPVKTL